MSAELLSLIVIALGISVFVALFALSRRRASIEKNLVALYETRCSVTEYHGLGFFSGSNVLYHRLAVYEDFLVITRLHPLIVHYSDIESLEKVPALSNAIKLTLRKDNKRRVMYLNCTDHDRVFDLIGGREVGVVSGNST